VLTPRIFELLKTSAKQCQSLSEESAGRLYRKLIRQCPEIVPLFEILIELGDSTSAEMIMGVAVLSGSPDLLNIVKSFAEGRRGSDSLRLHALRLVQQAEEGTGGPVPFWSNGERTDVSMTNYVIYTEPVPSQIRPKAQAAFESAMKCFNQGKYREAQRLLEHAIDLEPNDPSLRNNLAAVLASLGQEEESVRQIEQLHQRFPDYLFARCNLASRHARNGDTEEAKKLVEPILKIERLHLTEFTALCTAEIEIWEAEKNVDAVEIWTNMLRQVAPEHPMLHRQAANSLSKLVSPKFLKELHKLMAAEGISTKS
jgi:tetratricopeptide (TPR) repeat protein